jgi:DNA-directed RNA polymerase specialized sigma24 family protein
MTQPGFWTFDHPILDKLPPFDGKKIPSLVKQVQQGDSVAKEQLLEQLLSYIKTRLGKILSKETRLKNDLDGLVSHLIEWLVGLIEQIYAGKSDTNILHYVAVSLRFRCLNHFRTFFSYGPNHYEYCPTITQCDLCLEMVPSPSDASELLEKLQGLASTENELKFIYLRVAGYTNKEIAQQLNLTQTTVSRIRKTLLKRFTDES